LDARELQKIAGDCAVDLPGTDVEHRLDPDWNLYKVRGKVFMLMTDLPGRPVVILKLIRTTRRRYVSSTQTSPLATT
jgi:predicted DNA-binding protein (MmcQ/YjbR family)